MVVKQSCRSINSAALSNVLQSSGTRTELVANGLKVVVLAQMPMLYVRVCVEEA
jgi:hypothetical protein